jgi:hypothetical protein
VLADQDVPFLTKDGRVYRRSGDSSEPVNENNRYALDSLYQKTKQNRERFAEFCEDPRTMAKGESEQGWAQIFLAPYPRGVVNRPEILEKERIADLMKQAGTSRTLLKLEGSSAGWGLPLRVAYTTPYSVVLHQAMQTTYSGLSVEFFFDGRGRLLIPFEYRNWHEQSFDELKSDRVREYLKRTFETEYSSELSVLRFIDVGMLWLVIGALVSWYVEWLNQSPDMSAIDMAFRVEGVWRAVPFGDCDAWADHVRVFGLPVIRVGSIRAPEERGLALRYEIKANDDAGPWVLLCAEISHALGLPAQTGTQIFVETLVQRVAKSTPDMKGT